jgi:hypothetical protein
VDSNELQYRADQTASALIALDLWTDWGTFQNGSPAGGHAQSYDYHPLALELLRTLVLKATALHPSIAVPLTHLLRAVEYICSSLYILETWKKNCNKLCQTLTYRPRRMGTNLPIPTCS